MTHHLRLADLRVACGFEMPELAPWDGADDHPVDLTITIGPVPERLDNATFAGPIQQVRGLMLYLLTLPRLGRFLVREGREILIDPNPAADFRDVRIHILGSLQGVIWYQRGRVPLHGSVVTVAGRTLALLGKSGSGKSTLAAALYQQGCPVLADEICLLETPVPGQPIRVIPTASRLRVWGESLDALGIDTSGLIQLMSGKQKFLLPTPAGFSREPRTLDAACRLSLSLIGAELRVERLRGMKALMALQGEFHHNRLNHALNLHAWRLETTAHIANATPILTFDHPRGPRALPATLARLRELAEQGKWD